MKNEGGQGEWSGSPVAFKAQKSNFMEDKSLDAAALGLSIKCQELLPWWLTLRP